MSKSVTWIALALCLVLSFQANAQRFKKKSKYSSVGLLLNSMNYVGELDPGQSFISPSIKFTRMNLGAMLEHRMTPRVTARGAFSWGRIMGDDAVSSGGGEGDDIFRKLRNLNFRNDVYEFKIDGVVDLFENRRGLERRAQYTPYAFLGIAGFYHNPKANYGGSWVELQPLGTEGQYISGAGADKPYSKYQIAVPFGVGFRYKIGLTWDVAFEIGWRKTFTDYLDDVSTSYVERSLLSGDAKVLSDRSVELIGQIPESELPAHIKEYELDGEDYFRGYGREGDQRGDANSDWYIITGIHVSYIFHPKVICPKFRG